MFFLSTEKFFIICLLFIFKCNSFFGQELTKTCMIRSEHYNTECLYESSNSPSIFQSADLSVFTVPLTVFKDWARIRWSLILVDKIDTRKEHSSTFYLKSEGFGNFLCANYGFADIFKVWLKIIVVLFYI